MMKGKPLVSVVMPVHNCEEYIQEAVGSILAQTYGRWELLIVNNASTDRTMELAMQYGDERIRILNNEKNMGLLYSLQRGVREAKGELIARLDGDDKCMSTRLEKQVEYLAENTDVWLCGTKSKAFAGNKAMPVPFQELCDGRHIKAMLPFDSIVAHSSFMFRKKELEEAGIAYRDSDYCQDYTMLLDVALKARVGRVDECLVLLRQHRAQLTLAFGTNRKRREAGRTRRGYIARLPLSDKEKKLFYDTASGKLSTVPQLLHAAGLLRKYADICGLDLNGRGDKDAYGKIMQHCFLIQKKSPGALIAFLLCKDTNKRFLITGEGKKFVKECIGGAWRHGFFK